MNSYRSLSPSGNGETYHQRTVMKKNSHQLGYLGLLPFVALSIAFIALQSEYRQLIGQALVAYGAVIISFLGAHHWTLSVSGIAHKNMLYAVTPALIGWLAILMPVQYGMTMVIAGLLLTWYADNKWAATDAWYLVLRKRLTLVATTSVTIALVSTLRGI